MASDVLSDLALALAERLPGLKVEVAKPSLWRSLVRVSVAGGRATSGLHITAGDAQPLEVLLPRGVSPAFEPMVATIATAIEVRRYLGPAADHVTRLSFDHSSHGLAGRSSAGEAGHIFDTFHLNADYILDSADERFHAVERLPGVVAHEIWHVTEAALEARRYSAVVGLRRALGERLGVETLERATRGWAPGSASAASQEAITRLAAEVSDYATTNVKEAVAEMFKQWWTLTEPPPIVAYFGSLLPALLEIGPGPPRHI